MQNINELRHVANVITMTPAEETDYKQQQREKLYSALINKANLPFSVLLKIDFGIHNTSLAQRLSLWTPDERGILLCGSVGSGKSYLLSAMGYEAISKLVSGEWSKWDNPKLYEGFGEEVSAHLKYTTQPSIRFQLSGMDYKDHQSLICEYISPFFLIFDELGNSLDSERVSYTHEIIYEIINNRSIAKKPTFFGTNFSFETLKKRLGEPIVDRIREMSEPVKVEGKSLRQGKTW